MMKFASTKVFCKDDVLQTRMCQTSVNGAICLLRRPDNLNKKVCSIMYKVRDRNVPKFSSVQMCVSSINLSKQEVKPVHGGKAFVLFYSETVLA